MSEAMENLKAALAGSSMITLQSVDGGFVAKVRVRDSTVYYGRESLEKLFRKIEHDIHLSPDTMKAVARENLE